MLKLKNILMPVDFSGRCHGAAHYADALIRHFRSELTVLHVLPPPHYEFSAMEVGGPVLEELYRNRKEHAEEELKKFIAEELRGYSVSGEIMEGDPTHKIIEFSHDSASGLIMMPTHGYGPFRRFILGSVTAKVLHDADCPVWTGVHMEEALPACQHHLDHHRGGCRSGSADGKDASLGWQPRGRTEVPAYPDPRHANA